MRLTDENIHNLAGDSTPTTDGNKVRLLLAGFILTHEKLYPDMDWRENEINDDMLRIADQLDAQSGGVAPE